MNTQRYKELGALLSRKLLGLTAVAILILVATILPASAQDPTDAAQQVASAEEALQQDAESYAADVGVSVGEALRRLKLQPEIGELGARLAAQETETFGGLWIQHEPEYRVIVMFTDNGEAALHPYVKDGVLANLVEVREAPVTLAQLEAAQEAAFNSVRDLGIPVETGINLFESRVELYVTEPARLEAAQQRGTLQLPAFVKVVTVRQRSQPARNLYAGLGLSKCTSGFSVYDASGNLGITTAGHCDNTLSFAGINLPLVQERWYGPYDVQWHDDAPGITIQNWAKTGTGLRSITGTQGWGNQSYNAYVCKYGKVTQYTCGFIIDKYIAPSHVPYAQPRFIRVRNQGVNLSSNGDSGGPWYVGETAWGIHSADFTDYPNDALYMAINYLNDLNVWVLTQ